MKRSAMGDDQNRIIVLTLLQILQKCTGTIDDLLHGFPISLWCKVKRFSHELF